MHTLLAKSVFGSVFTLALALLLIQSCVSTITEKKNDDHLEAREDSISLALAYDHQSRITSSVAADLETAIIRTSHVDEDAADDMGLWVHPTMPDSSLIFGANKKGGVAVYDLAGNEIGFYQTGRINNIDVMTGFDLQGTSVDLVGCTNRTDQSIDLFRIDPLTRKLHDIAAHALHIDTNAIKDIYGFCFYKGTKPYLFISGKNGTVQQWEMKSNSEGKIDLMMVREIPFNSQTEGIVADELHKKLYVGEEDAGVWRLEAEPDRGTDRKLIAQSNEENPAIRFDVEGLAMYKKGAEGYLIASSQGNFSYAVFNRRPDNAYITSFKVMSSTAVDGIEESDGIDVLSGPFGSTFPTGVFAAQDGFNYEGDSLRAQNFKLVAWEKIDSLIRKAEHTKD